MSWKSKYLHDIPNRVMREFRHEMYYDRETYPVSSTLDVHCPACNAWLNNWCQREDDEMCDERLDLYDEEMRKQIVTFTGDKKYLIKRDDSDE
ncbi:hypothetical protein F4X90_20425 [Candidatus Poribacteria bacterium]|nr:hypothetical protein [Candidatus Poribacteria bacterium]